MTLEGDICLKSLNPESRMVTTSNQEFNDNYVTHEWNYMYAMKTLFEFVSDLQRRYTRSNLF